MTHGTEELLTDLEEPSSPRWGWRQLIGLERLDLWLIGALMAFAFVIRFFSPIYPDFLTHPTAWPPVHVSSPAFPYQTGHADPSNGNKLNPPEGEVFDEIYFAVFAHNDIVGKSYFDPEPPLAKHLIALGELAFGFNTFGWRIMSVLFGTFLVGALYLLAMRLWPNRFFAGSAAFLASIDGMMLVQSRIAMIDIFALTFILLAYWAFFVHLSSRTRAQSISTLVLTGTLLGLGVASKWITLAALGTMLLILLWRHSVSAIFAGGILAGVAATGVIVLRASPGALVFFLVAASLALGLAAILQIGRIGLGWSLGPLAGERWLKLSGSSTVPDPEAEPDAWQLAEVSEEVPPQVSRPRPAPGGYSALTYGALLGLCLALLPAAIYLVSFWRWLEINGGTGNLAHDLGLIANLHHQIWDYHSTLRATHPYGSPWYTWPFLLRPVAYFFEGSGLGLDRTMLPLVGNANFGQPLVSGIINLGNPAIWWPADVSLLVVAFLAIRERALAPAFLLLAFLAAWLPWAPVTRVLFMYHMFGGLPYMILALAYVLARLRQGVLRIGNPMRNLTLHGSDLAYGFLALALAAFVFWYPVWTALPVSNPAYLGPFPAGKMWFHGDSGSGGGYSWTFGWI